MQRASADLLARPAVLHPVCMVQSVLTNHTGRGESPAFPVVTPVTFRDLTLIYTFADGTRCAVPLYDQNNARKYDVDTDMFFLRSEAFPVRHPDHGSLTKVSMKGYYGTTLLHIKPASTGGSFVAEIRTDFELMFSHASADSFATLHAIDLSGNRYPVGTFSMVEVAGEIGGGE